MPGPRQEVRAAHPPSRARMAACAAWGPARDKPASMAIGVFDSGIGGLTVHHALVRRLPDADFIYLADQANTPLWRPAGRGDRRPDPGRLRAPVRRGLRPGGPGLQHRLGHRAAAAAADLAAGLSPRSSAGRSMCWASSCRPSRRPPACPGTRSSSGRGDKVEKLDILGIFSTPATAGSRVYEIEIDKRSDAVAVFSEPCPTLARLIEAGAADAALRPVIEGHVAGPDPPHRPRARPGHPRLHPLRDRRRPVPRRPAARHAADPPAGRHRRRARSATSRATRSTSRAAPARAASSPPAAPAPRTAWPTASGASR